MADRYLLRHSETELHLGEGGRWVSCHADALALTRLEVRAWLAFACEPKAVDVVPVAMADTHCCAA